MTLGTFVMLGGVTSDIGVTKGTRGVVGNFMEALMEVTCFARNWEPPMMDFFGQEGALTFVLWDYPPVSLFCTSGCGNLR
jgi:hypothetical protein